MASADAAPALLELPTPCLLAVLQCLADDPASLFSAARAHSRLHQAAVLALRSITVTIFHQQHADSILQYLASPPSQHLSSISLSGEYRDDDDDPRAGNHVEPVIALRRLPCNLQLSSIELNRLDLQLQTHAPHKGADTPHSAAARSHLKQLRLTECRLLDGPQGLAAVLSKLPSLEHLALDKLRSGHSRRSIRFPTTVLQQLQQLTNLELACKLTAPGKHQEKPALEPLQVLTRLVDVRFVGNNRHLVLAGMLSGARGLTRLSCAKACVEPSVLVGRTQLQHLQLQQCRLHPDAGPEGVAQLLSQLQELTQLTHLQLEGSLSSALPAAAYSALVASSKLQHLGMSGCTLPEGVWQHLFPAGRQLLHLRSLDISKIWEPSAEHAAAPEGSRLVSCCPGLQSLNLQHLQRSGQVLGPLQGLSGLHTLLLAAPCLEWEALLVADGREFDAVCQLTGLRELKLTAPDALQEELLMKLTQLQHLTRLTYTGRVDGITVVHIFVSDLLGRVATSDDTPVWRQILQLYLELVNVALNQQAAAALAEAELAAEHVS